MILKINVNSSKRNSFEALYHEDNYLSHHFIFCNLIKYNFIRIFIQLCYKMTSPQKKLEIEKQSTMFGELSMIQNEANKLGKKMIEQIQQIKRMQNDFGGMQKDAKLSTDESKAKLHEQVRVFQDKIKTYLIAQKAQYMRFSNQINAMIANSKDINSQLTILGNRFDQFQKNVGI